ncbi:MAG: HlyD family efflux transporter periplasmic adaptor subunit [Microcoleaceae cyanobacterium MO_207.B10]|nr:HlyD family efflux transporter periplasmic adaptor subunit [Microcoleaceae cyanobacterium MO_207.B10]
MAQDSKSKPSILFKPSNKWVAIFSVSALALAAFGVSQESQIIPSKLTTPAPSPTATPEAVKSLTALGRIEPQGEVIQLSGPSSAEGARIQELLVEVGNKVRKGEIIAVLDSRPRLQAALTEAQKEVKIRQAQLAKIRSGAKQGEIEAQKAEIAKLQAQLQRETEAQEANVARLRAQLQRENEAQEANVARLRAQLQRETEAQEANVARLRAQLQRETEGETARVAQFKAQLNRQREAQQANLDRLKAQLQGEIASGEATVNRVEAEWQNAQVEYQRYEELFNQGVVSASLFDSKGLEVETAGARLREVEAVLDRNIQTLQQQIIEAEADLNRTVETGQEQIREAEANLNRTKETVREQIREAEANLNRAKETVREQIREAEANLNRTIETNREQIREGEANLNRTIETNREQIREAIATLDKIAEVRAEDVEEAQATVEQAIALVEKAQAELDLAVVKSPINGQVLEVNTRPGERVENDRGIVELGQTEQMYVVAEVYETDIKRVRIGQKAVISGDSFSGSLEGSVEQIGMQIGKKDVLDTDPAADTDARVIEVKIRLDSDSSKKVTSLTNLQVDVQIYF